MESFLMTVARDLVATCDGDLSRTAVVFPNKRASLFFSQCLAKCGRSAPLWSPAYLSINELFGSLCPLQTDNTVRMVFELHKLFGQATGSSESIDDFYFWGELLLNDFDDIDKNLVDVDKLFTNLSDIKELEADHSYITPEQEEAIRHFFRNFTADDLTLIKRRFLMVWEKMGDIYHGLQARLSELGMAYEGMMYRRALDSLDTDVLPYERYVFVGFNFLTRAEHELMRRLRQAEHALFYWDYDTAYLHPTDMEQQPEAARFVADNLRDFPNQLPPHHFNNIGREKRISYLAASTENAQARYFTGWAETEGADAADPQTADATEMAVVLCNEDLLVPVLHSIPGSVADVNVTMGFPLVHTPVYSYLSALLDLQVDGYRKMGGTFDYDRVQALLHHPYVGRLSDQALLLADELTHDRRFSPTPDELSRDAFLMHTFTPQSGATALCTYLIERLNDAATLHRSETDAPRVGHTEPLYREALFKAYTLINRLLALLTDQQVDLQPATLQRLIVRMLGQAKIPFHGEPARGLQVMGLLETRCLDFRRLLVLSLNEGTVPRTSSESSFIPYPLRHAFGMTTPDHRDAVYAYTLMRLLQRAEDITLCYNSSPDNRGRGEMSRFMLQFLVHSHHPIRRLALTPPGRSATRMPPTIEKTPEMMQRLRRRYDTRFTPKATISPTALNTYLDCPLKYYLHYVAGIRVPEKADSAIDAARLGTLFHLAAQKTYSYLSEHDKCIDAALIGALLNDKPTLKRLIDEAFADVYLNPKGESTGHTTERLVYTGPMLIARHIVTRYLRSLLRFDAERYAPLTIEKLEQTAYDNMVIRVDGQEMRVCVGGVIDRMDRHEGRLRVVDYKTGEEETAAVSIEQLFTPSPKRPSHIFQAFLYSTIIRRHYPDTPVTSALIYLRNVSMQGFDPTIRIGERGKKAPVEDFTADMAREFRSRLFDLLEEIFGSETPFTPTVTRNCSFCDYRSICGAT